MLLDDVGHLNGQFKESVLEVKRRRQINHAHFYDFGALIFSRENGVTGPTGTGSIPSTIGVSGPFIGVNPIDSSHHDRPVHDSSIGSRTIPSDDLHHFGVSTSRLGGRAGRSFVSLESVEVGGVMGRWSYLGANPNQARASPLGPAIALESAA